MLSVSLPSLLLFVSAVRGEGIIHYIHYRILVEDYSTAVYLINSVLHKRNVCSEVWFFCQTSAYCWLSVYIDLDFMSFLPVCLVQLPVGKFYSVLDSWNHAASSVPLQSPYSVKTRWIQHLSYLRSCVSVMMKFPFHCAHMKMEMSINHATCRPLQRKISLFVCSVRKNAGVT